MDYEQQINLRLMEIKKLRKENRNHRLKYKKVVKKEEDLTNLISFINTPEYDKEMPKLTIEKANFSPPPQVSNKNVDYSCLYSICTLYPIGRIKETDNWFIVSPYINVPKEFIPDKSWFDNTEIYFAAIYHSVRLLLILSKELQRRLKYGVRFEDMNVFICKDGTDYCLSSTDNYDEFVKGVTLLNENAANFTGGEVSFLLPNLFFATNPHSTQLPPYEPAITIG